LRSTTEIRTVRGKGALTLKALEAMHIVDAVRRHSGNRTAAARELGINPSTLFRKIKSLGISLPSPDRSKMN
jgi:DNA-binding NtrC family response regulator